MSFSVKASTLKLFSVAVRATGKYENCQLSFTTRSIHLPNLVVEPETCVTMYGERVPYPKGRENPLTLPVSRHGIDAIQLGDENYPSDKMYNQAKIHYLEKRQYMMLGDIGKWVACGSNGAYVAGNTQRWVRNAAEFLFPRGENEYYLNCIGKELVCCVAMDAFTVDRDRVPRLESLKSNEYRVNAQYWDGLKFVQCTMKHSSGLNMMGVPKEVLHSMKDTKDMSLVRAEELDIYGPFNIRKKSRCYHNFRVMINGLETKTTAIEAHDFLLSYPVINRYRNVIDATAEEPVTMTPLPGRVNADNCNIEM